MLLSILLSMFLAEDQLQKVIIHHLLTEEIVILVPALVSETPGQLSFCSKPFFKSNIGYVKLYVPLNS